MAVEQGMQFFYGAYTHPKGEVYPKKIAMIPKFNDDGIRWGEQFVYEIGGNLVGQNPELGDTAVGARIAELDAVYSEDYRDCGFLYNDASQTPNVMLSNDADNWSGNRIIGRSWDNLAPTEYANTRSFSVTISAIYRRAQTSLYRWAESTAKLGTGGPIRSARATWSGVPYMQTITSQSIVRHVQQGELIGIDGWLPPPEPYWPNEELEHLREIVQYSPRYLGHPQYKPILYRSTYKYVFERIGADPVSPNLRYF